jgi:hypothetical protein
MKVVRLSWCVAPETTSSEDAVSPETGDPTRSLQPKAGRLVARREVRLTRAQRI